MTVQLERQLTRASDLPPVKALRLTGLAILLCGGFLPLLDDRSSS